MLEQEYIDKIIELNKPYIEKTGDLGFKAQLAAGITEKVLLFVAHTLAYESNFQKHLNFDKCIELAGDILVYIVLLNYVFTGTTTLEKVEQNDVIDASTDAYSILLDLIDLSKALKYYFRSGGSLNTNILAQLLNSVNIIVHDLGSYLSVVTFRNLNKLEELQSKNKFYFNKG